MDGAVAEWLKAHAWKACKQQCFEGSNPFRSSIKKPPFMGGFFVGEWLADETPCSEP